MLYPNVGGFGNAHFLRMGDQELVDGCVRAYNDFLTDWSQRRAQPARPRHALPFWDVDFAIARDRSGATANGHRAVNFCNQPESTASRRSRTRTGIRSGAAAQELGVPVSFHIGGGQMGTQFVDPAGWAL